MANNNGTGNSKIETNDKLSEVDVTLKEQSNSYYDITYQPWEVKQQLRLRNEVSLAPVVDSWDFTINIGLSAGTTLRIPTIGLPYFIEIQSISYNINGLISSDGKYTPSTWKHYDHIVFLRNSFNPVGAQDEETIIRCEDWVTWLILETRWVVTEVDKTWFTLSFSGRISWVISTTQHNVRCKYKAYIL